REAVKADLLKQVLPRPDLTITGNAPVPGSQQPDLKVNILKCAQDAGLIDKAMAEATEDVLKQFLGTPAPSQDLNSVVNTNIVLSEKVHEMLTKVKNSTALSAEQMPKLSTALTELQYRIDAAKVFQAAMR